MTFGEMREGAIGGVLVEGPIEFDAVLFGLTVARRDDNRRYEVPFLPVTGAIRPQEISDGRVAVELDIAVVVVVRVEDASGTKVARAMVSCSIPSTSATFNGQVNERGEVALLGTPGRFSFHLVSVADRVFISERIHADLEVTPNDRGERHIVLRAPA